MGKDDRPITRMQFGDDTEIHGDLVAGNKVSTGDIKADGESTVNIAGGDVIQVKKGGILIIQSGTSQTGPQLPPELKTLQIDDLLYYTVNCELQIDRLEETFAQHGGKPCCMLACMVPGDIDQAQEMFLKRIQVEILPQILDLDLERTPVGVFQLPWPGQVKRLEDLGRLLEKNLADNVLENRKGTKDQISQQFAKFQGPILIQTHIYHSVYQRWGVKALEAFMKFWTDWPELAPSQRLLIFACVYYQPPKKLAFFNRLFKRDPHNDLFQFIEKAAAEPTGPSHWVGLPPLEGANLIDATNWARREEVAGRFRSESIIEDLKQFYREQSQQANEDILIPLGKLAEQLKEIVPKYTRF